MDDATRKVVDKIAKIFQLAEKNPNKEEALEAEDKIVLQQFAEDAE